jgi:LmbE family N-acetylglucosaminyl deacetylase
MHTMSPRQELRSSVALRPRARQGLATCSELACPDVQHVVVLAPHPGDEVLAVGGILRALVRNGSQVTVVAMTDGEASHPRSTTFHRAKLAELRALERSDAFGELGLGGARVVRRASLCLAPWERDGHPDHDATGDAARAVCAAFGVPLLQYPVWAWRWLDPTQDTLPWSRVRRFVLDADAMAAKRNAIARLRSRVAPLSPRRGDDASLPTEVLQRFEAPHEVFLR